MGFNGKWKNVSCSLFLFCTAKCIDFYTKQRVKNIDGTEEQRKEIDPRLEAIVNRMFQRCFDDRQYKQVIGWDNASAH